MAGTDIEKVESKEVEVRKRAGAIAKNEGPRSVTFRDARITFRNFTGKEGQYNVEGDRNFALLIDDPRVAEMMTADGWNVKHLRARDEGEDPQPYIQVAVSYKFRPPRTELITSQGRTPIYEDMVQMFDWVDIEKVDLVINPSNWAVGGRSGIKAYLKTMFLTMAEDELELEYAAMPEVKIESVRTVLDAESTFLEDGEEYVEAELIEED